MYDDGITKQIRDTGKETNPTQKTKGNDKRKKNIQHRSCVSSEESRKHSKDKETFRVTFGMQMIVD